MYSIAYFISYLECYLLQFSKETYIERIQNFRSLMDRIHCQTWALRGIGSCREHLQLRAMLTCQGELNAAQFQ